MPSEDLHPEDALDVDSVHVGALVRPRVSRDKGQRQLLEQKLKKNFFGALVTQMNW
jgi:hypothetical protein